MNTEPTVQIIEYKTSDGSPARDGQTITLHYSVALSLESVEMGWWLERSFDKEPIRFVLGSGSVIRGIDRGLVSMRVGSTRRIVIPPELAFGSRGIPGRVPPDSALAFEVYLIRAD